MGAGGRLGVPEEVTGAEREIAFSVNCHPRETAEEGKQEKFHSCSPRCHLNLKRHLLTAPTHIDTRTHTQKNHPIADPFLPSAESAVRSSELSAQHFSRLSACHPSRRIHQDVVSRIVGRWRLFWRLGLQCKVETDCLQRG